jgi:hypothetical protein
MASLTSQHLQYTSVSALEVPSPGVKSLAVPVFLYTAHQRLGATDPPVLAEAIGQRGGVRVHPCLHQLLDILSNTLRATRTFLWARTKEGSCRRGSTCTSYGTCHGVSHGGSWSVLRGVGGWEEALRAWRGLRWRRAGRTRRRGAAGGDKDPAVETGVDLQLFRVFYVNSRGYFEKIWIAINSCDPN